MDKIRHLSELLKGFQNNGQVFFPATVESVSGNTCTVKIDSLSISDVRLKATTTKVDNQVLLTPATGSDVLVGSLSGDLSNLFVVSADIVDNIEITCQGQNLMDLFSQMLQALQKATVIVPQGSGTFDPGTISILAYVEEQLKMIFK
jgi:hypothetical protein